MKGHSWVMCQMLTSESIIRPSSAPTCYRKCSFFSSTFYTGSFIKPPGQTHLVRCISSQREIKNKAETGGLHFHVKVSKRSNVNQRSGSKSFIGAAFLRRVCAGSSMFCHWFLCGGSSPPVSAVNHVTPPTLSGGPVYKAARSHQVYWQKIVSHLFDAVMVCFAAICIRGARRRESGNAAVKSFVCRLRRPYKLVLLLEWQLGFELKTCDGGVGKNPPTVGVFACIKWHIHFFHSDGGKPTPQTQWLIL